MARPSPLAGSAGTILVFVAVLLIVATPARASCGIAPPMDEALEGSVAAFVGTVVELKNMRRWATVEVIDVWKGEVGPLVEVRGGPGEQKGGLTAVTSVDRYMRLGVTYLFVPYQGGGEVFQDNACSRTTRYHEGLARFRPTDAPTPSPSIPTHSPSTSAPSPAPAPGDDSGVGSWATGWTVGAIAAVGAAVAWVVIGRRRES